MDMGGGDDDDDSDEGGGGFDGDFGPGDDFDDPRDDVRHSGGEWEQGGRRVARTRVVIMGMPIGHK